MYFFPTHVAAVPFLPAAWSAWHCATIPTGKSLWHRGVEPSLNLKLHWSVLLVDCSGREQTCVLAPWVCCVELWVLRIKAILFSMLCCCTKIFSLTANQHGSWFLDRSYFQEAGCCTTASIQSSKELEMKEFEQCWEDRRISWADRPGEWDQEPYRGDADCSWERNCGYPLSLLQQLVFLQ